MQSRPTSSGAPGGASAPRAAEANAPFTGILAFTGSRADPVTLGYLLGNGYRAYLPALLRFAAPDTLSPFEAGGLNPYVYCSDDPINRTDPSGHYSLANSVESAERDAPLAAREEIGVAQDDLQDAAQAEKATHHPLPGELKIDEEHKNTLNAHIADKALKEQRFKPLHNRGAPPSGGEVRRIAYAHQIYGLIPDPDRPLEEGRFAFYDRQTKNLLDKTPDGEYFFAVMPDDPLQIRIASVSDVNRLSAITLSRRSVLSFVYMPDPVLFAGKMRFEDGRLVRWDNNDKESYFPNVQHLYNNLSPWLRRILPAKKFKVIY